MSTCRCQVQEVFQLPKGGDSRPRHAPVDMGIGRVEMEAEHDQAADMGIGRVEMEAEHDQAAD
jgi:hypothetical protein